MAIGIRPFTDRMDGCFFFFKQKTAYEIRLSLVGSEMCIRDRRESFGGVWELVWNDKLAKVPVVNGYMPNRETLAWDLDAGVLDLRVETLPFLPEIKIRGENLSYENGILNYTVGDKPPSTWDVFHAADGVVCAESSATGLNVIRRID